ncbi:MAG TPA: shikimate dehydrogenase [Kiritimatiellia bacterium]|nr:shikimate dehydrogenase [Kiritimatiellia bacterium]HRU71562.1 shikimate dehydrogenase [Kiritimatiellia bacterium]
MPPPLRFALLGHPVKHSLSPVMHEASFRALGLDAVYECIDIAPKALGACLATCRERGYAGLNVTVPHKTAVMAWMDRLDASARLYGAVNTVRIDANGFTGANTDAEGFLADLAVNYRLSPEAARVMVLGCGGAGRALAIACAHRGADEVVLANRTLAKAEQVAAEIVDRVPNASAEIRVLAPDPAAWAEACREADLVVQCTTAGLHADDAPLLPPEAFRRGQFLYDIVYTQRVTPTMRSALAAGSDAANGVGMLVYQGAAAFREWTGYDADTRAMRAALDARLYGT